MPRARRHAHAIIASALLLQAAGTAAQRLSGTLAGFAELPRSLTLAEVRGAEHFTLDRARVDRRGRFAFPNRRYPAGFYMLATSDTDRVDIILDPRERRVRLHFDGSPLQENITVLRSRENERLWEYKRASREAQRRIAAIRAERALLSPLDREGLRRSDSLEALANAGKQAVLDRLVAQDSSSFFARVILADRKLAAARERGSTAFREGFPWQDARLVRSTVYPKAIMAYLQSVPFEAEGGLEAACDSLLRWASADTGCWRFARGFLIQVFDQFGPDQVAQHLVERYVSGHGALLPAEARLQATIAARLRMAVGAAAPDAPLVDPGTGHGTMVSEVLPRSRYTLVFFYSSTCDHCRQQVPGLRSLWSEMNGKGLGIIGVAIDDEREAFLRTREELGIPWPTYSDLNGWGSTAAKAFHVKATPSFFLLDQAGTIVAKPRDHEEAHTILRELLR